jgi:glycosyltransferase involved in cell wall biosynthesis
MENNRKKVVNISVVIPLYNKENYIGRTIASLLNQTYHDYEVVVVDDGSSDDSVAIVQSFSSDKIRLIQKENGGPSSARNKGIQEAQGQWIVLLDADDILLPHALTCFANIQQSHPYCKYFVGNFYNMYSNQDIQLGSYRKIDKILKNGFYYEATRELTETSGTAMFEKSLLLEEPFNESLYRYEDAERQYRLMRKYKIYMFSTPVAIVDRSAACASRPRKRIEEDFIGSLVFHNKSFWEQMSLYLLALECKSSYPDDAERLYGKIYSRWDLRIVLKWVNKRQKLCHKYFRHASKQKIYTLEELLNIPCKVNITTEE